MCKTCVQLVIAETTLQSFGLYFVSLRQSCYIVPVDQYSLLQITATNCVIYTSKNTIFIVNKNILTANGK